MAFNLNVFMKDAFGKHWGSQVFSAIFAAVFGAAILVIALICGGTDATKVAANLLICLLGALVGWVVGIFFSPFDARDQKRLQYVGKSVAAFVSGYLLSTVQPLIASYTSDASKMNWLQVALFLSTFFLSALVVFVSRSYSLQDEAQAEDGKQSVASAG